MEFVDLSRYIPVKNPKIPPFSQLRKMTPLWMDHDLKILKDEDNISYANLLAEKGAEVVSIKRRYLRSIYADRRTFPRRVLLEMTSNCNCLCRMCPQQNLKRPKMDMDSALYRSIVDEVDSHGVESFLMFNIGESLLHPEFKQNLEHVNSKKNLGMIWFSTNGNAFNEEKIRIILDSKISYINFSAHAVTEATYKTVVSKGDFNVAQANLDKFYELKGIQGLPRKPFFHCQMIEQETTKHEVDAFIKKHYKRAEVVSINMLEHVTTVENNSFGFKQRERGKLSSCSRVSREDCLIFSNGDVTLCDAAYNSEIYLGNIRDKSLSDIWNGQERKKILNLNEQGRMYEIEFCRNCVDYDI